MGQGVSLAIVFSGKALVVVFASLNGALFGSLKLMSEFVSLQVSKDFTALYTQSVAVARLVLLLLLVAKCTWAATRKMRVLRGNGGWSGVGLVLRGVEIG
jgi:hypothetical protein